MKFSNICYLLLSLTCLASCKPNSDSPCRTQIVADSLVLSARQVFSGFDTLVFQHDSTDSCLLVLYKTDLQKINLISNSPGNPECPNDFIAYDQLTKGWRNVAGNMFIDYSASTLNDSCSFTLPNEQLLLRLSAIGNRDSTYLDSVQLNGSWYYGVNRVLSTGGTEFFIQSGVGVLQFNLNQKNYTFQSKR